MLLTFVFPYNHRCFQDVTLANFVRFLCAFLRAASKPKLGEEKKVLDKKAPKKVVSMKLEQPWTTG